VTDMRDELLERVVGELRALPPADEAAVRRIVGAAAADAEVLRVQRAPVRRAPWWQSRIPLAAAAGLALAAGISGYALRGSGSPARLVTTTTAPSAQAPVMTVADNSSGVANAPVLTQFILDAPRAAGVALVGDFNGWDPSADLLTRDSASGIWTVTVPLTPGRHVYAFMVDGKTLTLDPRAPIAEDPEFGTPSSVVLVGTP
jgi:hypothetical protein